MKLILDCFTFYNELDLLEIRLHTLAPQVDAFVLCEANRTFQGAAKPYVFGQNRNDPRFHCGKPLYAVQLDLSGMDGETNAWAREHVQRRAMSQALEKEFMVIGPHERIILSDVDEIPDLRVFDQLDPDSPTVIAWRQTLYYYWVNMRCWEWIGPVSCTVETFRDRFQGDMQLLRDSRSSAECIIDAGWHFSFLGGPEAIKEKIKAFSHTEYRDCAKDHIINWALKEGWKSNTDLFNRRMMRFELMPYDSNLPPYLVSNKDRFRDWWYTPSPMFQKTAEEAIGEMNSMWKRGHRYPSEKP